MYSMQNMPVYNAKYHFTMSLQPTLDVIFHGNKMGTIGKMWFGRHSQKYYSMLCSRNDPDQIDIEGDVSPSSVNDFINICNGGELKLTSNNALDLLFLSEDWQLTHILEAANQYFGQHPELLPEIIKHSMRQQRITVALEVLLRQHFVELCQDTALHASLRALGIHLLVRVFEANNHELPCRHLHEIFPFLLSCLRDKNIGGLASMLFRGINMDDLTDDELEQLAGERNMDFSVLPKSYVDLFKDIRSLQRTCVELTRVVQRLTADVGELKRRPVVHLATDDSQHMVSCTQGHNTMYFLPDHTRDQHVWECRFSPSMRFNGILTQMRKKCGRNPHLHGLITITSSGDERNHCWQVADPDWNDFYQTTNVENSFIQFDFKSSKVLLEGYSMLMKEPPAMNRLVPLGLVMCKGRKLNGAVSSPATPVGDLLSISERE